MLRPERNQHTSNIVNIHTNIMKTLPGMRIGLFAAGNGIDPQAGNKLLVFVAAIFYQALHPAFKRQSVEDD